MSGRVNFSRFSERQLSRVLQAFISGLLAGNVHVYDAGKLEMFILSFFVRAWKRERRAPLAGCRLFPFVRH
jgi:hypothetical protein